MTPLAYLRQMSTRPPRVDAAADVPEALNLVGPAAAPVPEDGHAAALGGRALPTQAVPCAVTGHFGRPCLYGCEAT